MRFTTLATLVACFLFLGMSACCGGQPTMALGMPTLQFGQNSAVPQKSVQVPMQPAYTIQAAPQYTPPVQYTAPCAPVQYAAPRAAPGCP